MTDIIRDIFKNKKVNFSKLEPFGFKAEGQGYILKKILSESGFELTVRIGEQGEVSAEIIDPTFGEPYSLHLADGASGGFIGKVRSEYEETLLRVSELCFEPDIFKSEQAKELISYVRGAYGDELEFLWQKFPENAVWRRSDNKKWYGAILTVPKSKLGIESGEISEIIDLRLEPEEMEALIDFKTYFPGWHMNKKNWYTVLLDGSVPLCELQARIDESYALAKK